MAELEVYLQGGSPWGFRLQGGKEFRLPLKIAKVTPGGKADIGGVKVGDLVREINGSSTDELYHTQALNAVKKAQYSLSLVLARPDEEDGNVVQSVGIAPDQMSTRISLKIGPKAPPKQKQVEEISLEVANVEQTESAPPQGQAYMKRLMNSQDDLRTNNYRRKSLDNNFDDDLPPVERQRSKTLPKKQTQQQEDTNMIYNSGSLPRKQETGPPNKAPNWYKQMFQEINSSMEGESHLTKLLSSDAKRGAFRKYDGASTFDETSSQHQRSETPPELQRTSTIDAPRRLGGGGRSIANHPNRKSLPNIHAANFNFCDPTRTGASTTTAPLREKPSVTSGEASNHHQANVVNRKSVNSDWYRQLQRGGEIPETGLAKSTVVVNNRRPTSPITKQSSYLSNEAPAVKHPAKKPVEDGVVRQISISHDYNRPPDFLELRRQELKNRDVEDERERVREQREKERLEEEERLKKQREADRRRVEEENRQQKEAEEKRRKQELIQKQKEEEERVRKEEERSRKEQEERLRKEQEERLPTKLGKAKHTFQAQVSEELGFHKGDVLNLIRAIDENWIEGELNGQVGIFPQNYIEYIEPEVEEILQAVEALQVESTPEVEVQEGECKAKYNFRPESDSELPFKKGEIIALLRQIDENWCEGRNSNDVVGIFPVNYVQITREPVEVEVAPLKLDPAPQRSKQVEEKPSLAVRPSVVVEQKSAVKQQDEKPQHPEDTLKQMDVDFDAIFNDAFKKEAEKLKTFPKDDVIPTDITIPDELMSNDVIHHDDAYTDVMTSAPTTNGTHQTTDIDDLLGNGEPNVCVYSYTPTNEDEVELAVDDIVYVLEKCDDGWFVGTSERTGQFGTFPGNYVKPYM